MSYILANIPYLKGYIRKHYLHDGEKGHGEFIEAIAHAVRCVRGSSMWFQCSLGSPYGGAMFMVPISGFVWKPCLEPDSMNYISPWDCFGSDFSVVELDFVKRGAAYVLPDRRPGQYWCSIDWTNTDLADDMEQHKILHLVRLEGGLVGAFPNNRLLMPDSAFWPIMDPDFKPDLVSYSGECRAEGNEHLFADQWRSPLKEAAE